MANRIQILAMVGMALSACSPSWVTLRYTPKVVKGTKDLRGFLRSEIARCSGLKVEGHRSSGKGDIEILRIVDWAAHRGHPATRGYISLDSSNRALWPAKLRLAYSPGRAGKRAFFIYNEDEDMFVYFMTQEPKCHTIADALFTVNPLLEMVALPSERL